MNIYSMIAVEELAVRKMVKNHHQAKSISDAGWSAFLAMLCCKAEEAGSRVVKVDPSGTSQECIRCGTTVAKDLSVRVHKCHHCGLVLDRDVNAARKTFWRKQ